MPAHCQRPAPPDRQQADLPVSFPERPPPSLCLQTPPYCILRRIVCKKTPHSLLPSQIQKGRHKKQRRSVRIRRRASQSARCGMNGLHSPSPIAERAENGSCGALPDVDALPQPGETKALWPRRTHGSATKLRGKGDAQARSMLDMAAGRNARMAYYRQEHACGLCV